MGKKRGVGFTLAAILGLGRAASGQLGGIPSIPSAPSSLPTGLPAGAGAAAAAVPQKTIFGMFGLSHANLAACKAKLCQSQIGTMLNNGLKPVSMFAGGLVPSLCPPANASALASQAAALGGPGGPAGAQATAAAIQADVAGAPARIAAVEYLATVDCHYWPEAEAALIGRLRSDRIECVRYAAARALLSGCCCTKKTVEALTIVVSGSDKDSFPSETSERVRAVAFAALEHCLSRFVEPAAPPVPPEPPEPLPPERPGAARPASAMTERERVAAYYEAVVARRPTARVLADARRALQLAADAPMGRRILPTGSHSLTQAATRAGRPVVAVATASVEPSRAPARMLPAESPPAETAPVEPPPSRASAARPSRADAALMRVSAPPEQRPTARRGLFGLLQQSARPADTPR
jgi:hypothetical protein